MLVHTGLVGAECPSLGLCICVCAALPVERSVSYMACSDADLLKATAGARSHGKARSSKLAFGGMAAVLSR